MTAARALGALLWPRWRGALNAPRSKAGGRRGRLLVIGLLAHVAGVLVERWLFFAEARHTVMLYYGDQAS